MSEETAWKKCSTCKKPIPLGGRYYVCSVSTCNGQRTGYSFCSVICFESHLPGARHRDAGAIEKTAPNTPEAAPMAEARPQQRIMVRGASSAAPTVSASQEVLVIASRLKEYIHARSEFNTSASVMDVLSQHLRLLCDRAIDHAREEGRKTVMDRDFEFLRDLK